MIHNLCKYQSLRNPLIVAHSHPALVLSLGLCFVSGNLKQRDPKAPNRSLYPLVAPSPSPTTFAFASHHKCELTPFLLFWRGNRVSHYFSFRFEWTGRGSNWDRRRPQDELWGKYSPHSLAGVPDGHGNRRLLLFFCHVSCFHSLHSFYGNLPLPCV